MEESKVKEPESKPYETRSITSKPIDVRLQKTFVELVSSRVITLFTRFVILFEEPSATLILDELDADNGVP